MEGLTWAARIVGIAAIGVLPSVATLGSEPTPVGASGDLSALDDQAFGALLRELAKGERSRQAELLSRVVDLPASKLVDTMASIPLAHYEVDARPNTIGLRAISYRIVSDQSGEDRRLRSALFTFDARSEDEPTCAKFTTARAALGMDTGPLPPPVVSLHAPPGTDSGPHPITAFIALGHVEARILTHTVARPCLVTVSFQFIEPAEGGTPGVRSYEARHRYGFQQSALRAFFGENSGSYLFSRPAPLIEQIGLTLGIPDDLERMSQRSFTLGRGYALTIGCRQHSCPEKGAVISDGSGKVVRAALISSKCDASGCQSTSTLTVFKNPAQMGEEGDQEMLDKAIRDWAEARVPAIETETVELQAAR